MAQFTKKALIATVVVAGLAATPIVYAATDAQMPGAFAGQMTQGRMMGGNDGFAGMGMARMMGSMDQGDMMGQMPEMTADQLAFMQKMLAQMPADQRAFMEQRLKDHGVTLPQTK